MTGAPRRGLVSVVVAGYNCASFVEPTLWSVLDQTWRSMEIVFVDDGSTDGTLEVVGRLAPRVRCLSVPHGGVCAARNAGIRATTGQFVAILDHDDLWAAEKVSRQVALLEAHPDVGLVFTRARVAGDPSHPPILPPPGGAWESAFRGGIATGDTASTYLELLKENFVPLSSILFRRAAMPTEGFRGHLRFSEDHDFLLRMAELQRFAFLDEPLTTYTIRPGRASERMADMRLEDLAVLADNLDRNAWLLRRDPAGIRRRQFVLLKEAAYWLLREGRAREAQPLLRKAWRLRPLDWKLPAWLVASLAGGSGRGAGRPER